MGCTNRGHNGHPKLEGMVFEIQRWSGNDGPGIRTVVFFKGCPLRCLWCCNPESWDPFPRIAFFGERCRDCGRCREVCSRSLPQPGHEAKPEAESGCTACARCVAVCRFGARELMGRTMAVGEVLSAIERDRVFFRQSGGGVTFSGGEPLAQAAFLGELVERCRAAGLSMVLETSGHFHWSDGHDILAAMDLVFVDLKHLDPAVHRRITGVDNRLILDNVLRMAHERIPLVIRVPLIPTVNDSNDNLVATATFVAGHLAGAVGVEVLPYHALGKGKYAALGSSYPLGDLAPPGAEQIARARAIFLDAGVEMVYMGSTPPEDTHLAPTGAAA